MRTSEEILAGAFASIRGPSRAIFFFPGVFKKEEEIGPQKEELFCRKAAGKGALACSE
jgi:hypothetical protein